jgi:hypothetical protein
VDELRELLRTEGGEVIFTTVEKFRMKSEEGEIEHPVLSTRSNIIVIADEAHRSQYGFLKGYARYLSEALPNARRIGFTGTPISFSGADTVEVFGDLIHWYDIKQSQDDKATVPIFYEPRQTRLHLNKKMSMPRWPTSWTNSRWNWWATWNAARCSGPHWPKQPARKTAWPKSPRTCWLISASGLPRSTAKRSSCAWSAKTACGCSTR